MKDKKIKDELETKQKEVDIQVKSNDIILDQLECLGSIMRSSVIDPELSARGVEFPFKSLWDQEEQDFLKKTFMKLVKKLQ